MVKAAEYLRQRRGYWDARADGIFRREAPVAKELVGDRWYYLNQNTQENLVD